MDVLPLGVFSIHNFNSRNLKGNGNAATVPSRYLEEVFSSSNNLVVIVLKKCFPLKRISPFRVDFELCNLAYLLYAQTAIHTN